MEKEEHIEYEDEDFDMDFDIEYKCNERRDQMAELLSLYLILGRFLGVDWMATSKQKEALAITIFSHNGSAILCTECDFRHCGYQFQSKGK